METQVLFRTDEILVTPVFVRFGRVSLQVANITASASLTGGDSILLPRCSCWQL